jgi:hypothetical protein
MLALQRLRQEDSKVEDNLTYIANPGLKRTNKETTTKNTFPTPPQSLNISSFSSTRD